MNFHYCLSCYIFKINIIYHSSIILLVPENISIKIFFLFELYFLQKSSEFTEYKRLCTKDCNLFSSFIFFFFFSKCVSWFNKYESTSKYAARNSKKKVLLQLVANHSFVRFHKLLGSLCLLLYSYILSNVSFLQKSICFYELSLIFGLSYSKEQNTFMSVIKLKSILPLKLVF